MQANQSRIKPVPDVSRAPDEVPITKRVLKRVSGLYRKLNLVTYQTQTVQIRYSSPNEVEISGTVEDLQMVKRRLLDVAMFSATSCEVEAETNFDPYPYASTFIRMVVVKNQGPVKATVICDEYLQVEASSENLEVFSSFFDFEPNIPPGRHYHHEYYEENQYIAPDSVPLVIGIK